nr:MAG TPA: hypothetical protein [Caudoviricetes sp.]
MHLAIITPAKPQINVKNNPCTQKFPLLKYSPYRAPYRNESLYIVFIDKLTYRFVVKMKKPG